MLNFITETKSIPKEFLTCVSEHMEELECICYKIANRGHESYVEDEIVTTINKYVYGLKSTLYANLKMLDDYSSSERMDICPIDSMVSTLKEVEDILYNRVSKLLEKYKIQTADKCFRVYFATMMELYKMTLKSTVNETKDDTTKVKAIRVVSRSK